jgi:hypothetical protein
MLSSDWIFRIQAVRNGTDGFFYGSRTLAGFSISGCVRIQPAETQKGLIYIPLKCTGFQGGVTKMIVFWVMAPYRNVHLPGSF